MTTREPVVLKKVSPGKINKGEKFAWYRTHYCAIFFCWATNYLMPPRTVVPLSASSLSLALLGFGCKRRNYYEITNLRIVSDPKMDQIMNNYCNAMLILGLILSLTCLVYCSTNGSSSSDFIVNATQRNLSCKDFLRNIEIEWEQWVVERRWQYWARHYRSRHQLMPVMAPQFAPPLSSLAPVVNIFKVVGLFFAMSR